MNKALINENKCIGRVEYYYLKEKRNNIHISLEDLEDTEWFWSLSEVVKFDRLWKQGTPLKEMAKELRRSEVAVFLQALDRIEKGKVKPRNWNIW